MITHESQIRPFKLKVRPIVIAAQHYLKWKCSPDFFKDMMDYLENGIVVSRHDVFAMGKIVDARKMDKEGKPIGDTPEPALFIRMAVGNLCDLMGVLPVLLPKILFCRRNEKRIREYDLDKLLKVTHKLYGRRT